MGKDRHEISSFIPISVLTDSYKASHFEQYPDATRMVAVRPLCMCLGFLFDRIDDINFLVCSMVNLEGVLMGMRRIRGSCGMESDTFWNSTLKGNGQRMM